MSLRLQLQVRLTFLAIVVAAFPAASFAQSFAVVHPFAGPGREPELPVASLIQGADGRLYGTSAAGGVYGDGTIFRLTLDGTLEVVYSFNRKTGIGSFPLAPLIQAADGAFYGTLARLACNSQFVPGPGFCSNGLRRAEADGPSSGAAFAVTPDGTLSGAPDISVAPDRPAGDPRFVAQSPVSVQTPFLQMADGTLLLPYVATTTLTPSIRGYITRRKADGTVLPGAYLPPTGGPTGPGTFGPAIQATDGMVYGTTSKGGASDAGTIYRMASDLTVTFAHEFTGGTAGATPRSIIQASDGNFYGTTEAGGGSDGGTVFRMAPDATVTILHSFDGADGRAPVGSLIQAADGSFFGTTAGGGAFGRGVVFRMAADGTITVLYSFGADASDGESPQAGLLQASDGNFYGTTKLGGHGVGTVFRITPSGTLTILARFGASDGGGTPTTPLTLAADGNLYGMTRGGVKSVDPESPAPAPWETRPTFYRITVDHRAETLRVLDERFGGSPVGGLVQGNDGNLYGVTSGSGLTGDFGTIFRATTQGAVTLLHPFAGSPDDGVSPNALVKAPDGTFLGTTSAGGAFGKGTVFRVTPDGTIAVLHHFAGTPDGESPASALILATDGNYYGTTNSGGNFGEGTVYRFGPSGVSVLYSFQRTGSFPNINRASGLVQGDDGYLYGTIGEQIVGGIGMAYRITSDGVLTALHTFTAGGPSGAPLIQASDGAFYGTTARSSSDAAISDAGKVFRMTRSGVVDVQASFPMPTGGEFPPFLAPLVQAADGALWATIGFSVAQSVFGLVYRIDLHGPPSAPTTLVRASVSEGVKLSWAAVVTATSYTVRRAESSGAETQLASGVQGTVFVDTTAQRGRVYYYTVTAVNDRESESSYEVSVRAGQRALNDFDGDGRTDPAVYRPSTGYWLYTFSAPGAATWGATRPLAPVAGDTPMASDYDGDGKTDLLMYRSSNQQWYVSYSSKGYTGTPVGGLWGVSGDVPVSGDFDGDGKTDLAVYRPSTGYWLIRPSSDFNNWVAYLWGGVPGDIPVPADYDGDGTTDPAIYRPSNGYWFIMMSSQSFQEQMVFHWGIDGDVPVPGDYDGDGLTDVAVYRPSTGHWLILKSSTPYQWVAYWWGIDGDLPVPGDYDGDGKIDVAVYRPSSGYWIILESSSNFTQWSALLWGIPDDLPLIQPR